MATHSSILAWRISWREEPGGLQSMSGSHKELDMTKRLTQFRIMVLEKPLESPLDSEEINQLILKEINPEYSLEGPMLKLQNFGHLM